MHPLFSDTMIADLRNEIELCLDEMDLAGLTAAQATDQLQEMLDRYQREEGADPRNVVILRFPMADGSGSETLFQPVARFLAQATRNGDILMSRPLPEELGGGFYIRISPVSGQPDA